VREADSIGSWAHAMEMVRARLRRDPHQNGTILPGLICDGVA
jgi:hypothetical protein